MAMENLPGSGGGEQSAAVFGPDGPSQPQRMSTTTFLESVRTNPKNATVLEERNRCCGAATGTSSWPVDREHLDSPWFPDLSWVEGAQMRAAGVLLTTANLIALVKETDDPSRACWQPLNFLFLMLLFLEVSLRMLYRGPKFLARTSIVFDISLVVLGIIDLLVSLWLGSADRRVPLTGLGSLSPLENEKIKRRRLLSESSTLLIVRFFHITRLCRIFRIFHLIRRLAAFTESLRVMFKSFAWIFLGMVITWFVLAIILTRLLGQGLLLEATDEELRKEVQAQFHDILSSMYALFQLTTLDDWVQVVQPVIDLSQMWQWLVMAYIILMSWTVLSLLAAVASETLITASSTKKNEEIMKEEMKKQGFMGVIFKHFVQADEDGNNQLDKEEFKSFMAKEDVKQEFKMLGMNLDELDHARLWDTFDVDESGSLSIEEIVQGFVFLAEHLATKHVANIGYAMKRFNHSIDKSLQGAEARIDEIQEKQDSIIERVKQHGQMYKESLAEDGMETIVT